MKSNDLLTEFYNPENDKQGVAHFDDTRRPRLTLMHLQRLRKARDTERYDKAQYLNSLPEIYGSSDTGEM
jgi:hypothetical protein